MKVNQMKWEKNKLICDTKKVVKQSEVGIIDHIVIKRRFM